MGDANRRADLAGNVVRWSARVLGGLLAVFFFAFLIPEAVGGEWGGIAVADAVALTAIVVMVVALVVGWFWEGVAAGTLLVGSAVLAIATGRPVLLIPPYFLFPVLGLMFAFCFWRSRKTGLGPEAGRRRDVRRLAILAGALLGLMAIAAGLVVLMSIPGSVTAAPPEWVGEWRGEFDVIQRWWPAGVQPVILIIRPDGRVEGSLGDAVLVNGQMRERNRIEIWFGNSRRIINAGLEGWVVEEEAIAAQSVSLSPRSQNDRFQLSFETQEGTHNGEEFGAITSNPFFLQRVE